MTKQRQLSPDVRADFDLLINQLLPFAQQELQTHGNFLPFAASMTADRKIAFAMGAPGNGSTEQMIDLLRRGISAERSEKNIISAGVCVQIKLDQKVSDADYAILVTLEHCLGESADVYLPFRIAHDGSVTYLLLISQEGTLQFSSK